MNNKILKFLNFRLSEVQFRNANKCTSFVTKVCKLYNNFYNKWNLFQYNEKHCPYLYQNNYMSILKIIKKYIDLAI